MYISSTDKLYHFIQSQLTSIDCISFDVFDTLIRRKIAPPEQVKVASAKTVSLILKKHGVQESAENCLTVRRQIEANLKKLACSGSATTKFHLKDIIRDWLNHYLSPPSVDSNVRSVYQSELEAEFTVCYAPHDVLSLVKDVSRFGKQLIFISDMYMVRSDIDKILAHCGYEGIFSEGFVSSEIGLCKQNGKLFEYVCSNKNIEPARMIHVGDNVSADYVKPRLIGIQAVLFIDKKHNKWQHCHYKLLRLSRKNPFWEGARWSEMTPHDSDSRSKSSTDLPYAIGYWILGPIFTTFMHETVRRMASDGCQTVIFPAREGFLLKKLYEILVDAELGQNAIPAHYIFLSRRSTFLASAHQIGVRELTRGHEKTVTLRIICNKLNLDIELLKPIIDQFSFYRIDDIIYNPCQDARLCEFLNHPDFLTLYNAARHEQLELLSDYLSQFGFFQVSHAAIVDVGWVGTIQESLAKAFLQNEKMPSLRGYYMALLDRSSVPVQQTERSKQCGIFFNFRTDKGPAIIDRFTELIENAARAPHESTIGYRRTSDGTVVPVLNPIEKETSKTKTDDSTLIASLQTGILEYAQTYKRYIPFQLRSINACKPFYLAQWERLTRFPKRHEAKVLRNILHTNEFIGKAAESGYRTSTGSNQLQNFLTTIREGMIWPEGFYSCLKIPGANLLFNLYRLARKNF